MQSDMKLKQQYRNVLYLFSTSNKKARDWYCKFSYRLEIWPVAPQHVCQAAPVIFQSTCLEYLNTQSHSFESSRDMRDLKIRRPSHNLVILGTVSMSHIWNGISEKYFENSCRKTDYPTCNKGSPIAFIGPIWRSGDRLWTALTMFWESPMSCTMPGVGEFLYPKHADVK